MPYTNGRLPVASMLRQLRFRFSNNSFLLPPLDTTPRVPPRILPYTIQYSHMQMVSKLWIEFLSDCFHLHM